MIGVPPMEMETLVNGHAVAIVWPDGSYVGTVVMIADGQEIGAVQSVHNTDLYTSDRDPMPSSFRNHLETLVRLHLRKIAGPAGSASPRPSGGP